MLCSDLARPVLFRRDLMNCGTIYSLGCSRRGKFAESRTLSKQLLVSGDKSEEEW
jgi:hypothetical protein